MDFSAKLSLPYLLPNQAQKHVTLNDSVRRLDALVQLSVISADQTVPPEDPAEGDRYIADAPSAGAWAGTDGQVAAFQDGVWTFYPPQIGWTAWDEGTSQLLVFDGERWAGAGGTGEAGSPEMLGINAGADATNRLTVSSPASLLTHEGAGHQLKINKASAADTASVLFQTNWSGRAEFGLTGSDDVLLKVSADGQSFAPALLARPSNGFVGIGTWSPTAPLHVEGAVRIGVEMAEELPDAGSVGAGTLIFLEHADHSIELVYSDGSVRRSVQSGASIA
jgi:hypothetical protein